MPEARRSAKYESKTKTTFKPGIKFARRTERGLPNMANGAVTTQPQLKPKPKGQRPRCLHCEKELQPQFDDLSRSVHPILYGAKLEKWKKENPGWQQFTGHYGRYKDDRFCGLNCGYSYAVAHTKAQKGQ
jgi:hypothetical protein